MRLILKSVVPSDGCGVQYVQRQPALGPAALYSDTKELAKKQQQAGAASGVIGIHIVVAPHCKCMHDAVGKVFIDNQQLMAAPPLPLHF